MQCPQSARIGLTIDKRSQNFKFLSELERAGFRHPSFKRARGQRGAALYWNLARRDQTYSRNPVVSYDLRQAIARKPISGQRPHHEQIAAIPRRWVNEPT